MREVLPTILIDTREKIPYLLTGYETKRCKLNVGDYMVEGSKVAVERKSMVDFFQTIGRLSNRGRFEREMIRAKRAGIQLWVVVESGLDDALACAPEYTRMNPSRMIESFIGMCIAHKVIPLFANERKLAERMTISILRRGYFGKRR